MAVAEDYAPVQRRSCQVQRHNVRGLYFAKYRQRRDTKYQIGPKMGIESRSLTRTLKTMEEKGLIERSQAENDGRLVLIHLTEEGKKYRDTSREVVLTLNAYLQSHIEPEKLKNFFEVATQMNVLLDNKSIFTDSNLINKSNKTQ